MRLRAGSRRAPLHTAFVPAGAHAGSAPARFASAFTRTAGRPARAVTVAAADPAPSRATCRGPSPPERQETNMPALADIGDGLVPKRETGVAQFLSRHPDCNGDNVVVAILDTGVDPGAPGLRLMPDGTSPKVIDCIDCTGGGDVEMFDATVVEPAAAAGPLGAAPASGDGAAVAGAAPTLTGLSGRSLTLTPEMVASNPTGAYRVGLKAAYALLPKPLVARLKRERRVRFDEAHRVALNAVHRRLDDVRRAADAAAGGEPKAAARLAVEEAEAHEARLIAVAKACEDPGPIYDCVTFHDGRRWRAVVDTSESGDLARCQLMEDYRLACRYATLHDLVNYTTNIWDDGRTLSICVDSGAHGTHVAGMVAAHYPDPGSHMSGSAPGAQIVSLKIGDTRLGAMETHQGLVRALAYLLAHSRAPGSEASAANDGILVDLVNMSFGEPTRNPNHVRVPWWTVLPPASPAVTCR
jgi:tripeptidyl-peptidase II